MLQALRMVESVESQLQKVSRDFERMHKKATDFCIVLDELLIDIEIEIEKTLQVKRRIQDPVGYFRINTYNVIMDNVLVNMKKRFTDHKELYKNFSLRPCTSSVKCLSVCLRTLYGKVLRARRKIFLDV